MGKKHKKAEGSIVMTEDSVVLTGEPATVMRAMLRGLKQEVKGKGFPGRLDDWECALAHWCSEVVISGKIFDLTGRGYKTTLWRGNRFTG